MEQTFRIKLKSYDSRLLEISIEKIVKTLKGANATIGGPIVLPTKKEIFTVLRSPHVNKKSREQFLYPTHKRIIDVYTNGPAAVEALMKLELNSGVEVEIRS
jgi:small subunit ribosomal protein S10